MTSLLSAKKRAEEFAAAVEGGADSSSLRPETAELVAVVGTLQRETPPVPRAEFSAALRERLMAEAATSLAGDNILALPTRRKGSRERRMALAASSLVLIGGTAGMAAAAQNALPGEALYPIKRGLEKAQTGLSASDAARGKDLLAQADSRLVEVQGLIDQPTGTAGLSQVPATIEDFTAQAYEAAEVLLDEYEQHGDDSIIEELRTFAVDNLDELRQLAKSAPPEHHDELAVAADALMQIAARAEAICPDCAPELQAMKLPSLFLTANEARRAMAAAGGAKMDNSHPPITEDVRTAPPKGDDKPASPPQDDDTPAPPTAPAPGPGGNTGGGTDAPATPQVPLDGGIDTNGPTTGDKPLGGATDEVTKNVPDGGGDKDSKSDEPKNSLPKPIEDITEIIVP